MRDAVIERSTCPRALRLAGPTRTCGSATRTIRHGTRIAPPTHDKEAVVEPGASQAVQSGRSPVTSGAGPFGSAALRRGSCFASVVVMARLSLPTAP